MNVRNALMPHIKKAAVLHEWFLILHASTLILRMDNFVILVGWKVSRCLTGPSTWCGWLWEAKHVSIILYKLDSILYDVKGISIVWLLAF